MSGELVNISRPSNHAQLSESAIRANNMSRCVSRRFTKPIWANYLPPARVRRDSQKKKLPAERWVGGDPSRQSVFRQAEQTVEDPNYFRRIVDEYGQTVAAKKAARTPRILNPSRTDLRANQSRNLPRPLRCRPHRICRRAFGPITGARARDWLAAGA